MTGRNFGAASVVWQVIWPILLYSFVTTVMALLVGARLDVMWILLISAILTSGVLYYFYSRRRQTEGRHYGPSWRVRLDIGTGAALLRRLRLASDTGGGFCGSRCGGIDFQGNGIWQAARRDGDYTGRHSVIASICLVPWQSGSGGLRIFNGACAGGCL